MPNKRNGRGGPLPAPTGDKSCRLILAACDHWNAFVCYSTNGKPPTPTVPPTPPGPIHVPSFLAATDRLLQWRDTYAKHLDLTGLSRFRSMFRNRARAVGDGGFVVTDQELLDAAEEAVCNVHRIVSYLNTVNVAPSDMPGPDMNGQDPDDDTTIPAERRTRPLGIAEAARLMGFKSKKAGEVLRRSMDDGAVKYKRLTRQSYVFDRDAFPAAAHPKLTPTDPK
jgi:hypothetical protein